ncbi:MAG: Hsp20/alpha crystallin family protein [Desulfobacteraceae bacterium]|jgi:HSP20 family protein|nr:MAG: Hsp20/alpha crystallin family protein [Desulfobacteraceae bacterium]
MHYIKARFDSNLGKIPENFQKLFNELIKMNINRPLLADSPFGWTPEADLYETDDEVILAVNLAGVRKEDIEVSFHGTSLRVSGRRLPQYQQKRPNRFFLLEIGSGDFDRIFRLSHVIDDTCIEASFSDGMLTVRMKRRTKPCKTHVKIKD